MDGGGSTDHRAPLTAVRVAPSIGAHPFMVNDDHDGRITGVAVRA